MSESARLSSSNLEKVGHRLQNQASIRSKVFAVPIILLILHTLTDCSRTRDAVPLAVATVYQWQWHRSKVPLVVAACAAWCGVEQKKAVQAVNAMPCKYTWAAAGRTGTMSTYK